MAPPTLTSPIHILIVGGSLASLFTAIPLLRLGHHVTILERSPTPLLHDQGAGIVAGGETLAWFERFDSFRTEIAVESRERLYLDREGVVVDREAWRQRMTSWDLCWHVARAGFDGVEGVGAYVDLEKVGEEVKGCWERARYEFGREVVGVKGVDKGVKVKWRSTKGDEEGRSEGVVVCDYLVVADGPSSHVRSMVEEVKRERKYVGYVAFRGTVAETELSDEAKKVFVERFTFYHADGVQILAYTIPGTNGSLEVGERLVNWVWYQNIDEQDPEYEAVMTDSDGSMHRFTLPTGGKMSPKVWQNQKERGADLLPPQFAELVNKTEKPFVQAITDVEPPAKGTKVTRFLDDKAAVVGDALAGFRPHTAASTSQAAFDAMMLEKAFAGQLGWEQCEKQMLDFAWSWQQRGVMLGERSQHGRHPLSRGGQAGSKVSREELNMHGSSKS